MRKLIIMVSGFLFLMVTSCYFDNAETLHPEIGTTCDLTNVTYSGTVVPILRSYCYACHSGSVSGASGGGITLDNYGSLKQQVSNNKLWGSVNHSSGFSPMPKGGTKLDNCTLQKIKKWMDDGAQNN